MTTQIDEDQNNPIHEIDVSNLKDDLQDLSNQSINFHSISNKILPDVFMESKGIKICHINANRIRNKFDDIKILLQQNNMGVLAGTESKLDPHRDSINEYAGDNFQQIRKDRSYNAGGITIVYIHSSLCYEIIDWIK